MKRVQGVEDPEEGFMDDEGNMITGFNLKDEMEDGEFDSTGQFHFRKEKREDRDEWLDTVDWKEIKKIEQKKAEQMESDKDKDDQTEADMSEKSVLEEILKI